MKIFKHRNLMGCIYSILIAIPFLSILATTCYVAMNKNAHESYYGETINDKEIEYTNDLYANEKYYIQNSSVGVQSTDGFIREILYVNDFKIEGSTDDFSNVNHIRLYINLQGNIEVLTYSYNNTIIGDYYITLQNYVVSFNYEYTNLYSTATTFVLTDFDLLYKYNYNKYSYMDNAFDYSLSKFVSDHDFGKLNLFEWFWSIFLTNNSQNMLYIHFVNWYMNYVLLVSSAYILFLVLMWFINFSRRILERGMNYDW